MAPASVPEIWVALATMVSSTVCKSSVEFTAWDTSPSARSSSTECVSSDVRACNSPSSRAFSIAMTAWAAKFCTSAICLSENDDSADQQIVLEHRHAERGTRATELHDCGVFSAGVPVGHLLCPQHA